jgi:hypothetical protein
MASEYRGLGLNGGIYINDNAAHAGKSDICTGQDATTLAANTAIYGNISSITLTSGAVIAYNI